MSNPSPVIKEVNLTLDDIEFIIRSGPDFVQLLCVLVPMGVMKKIPGVREMAGEGVTDEVLDNLQSMGIKTARIGRN